MTLLTILFGYQMEAEADTYDSKSITHAYKPADNAIHTSQTEMLCMSDRNGN